MLHQAKKNANLASTAEWSASFCSPCWTGTPSPLCSASHAGPTAVQGLADTFWRTLSLFNSTVSWRFLASMVLQNNEIVSRIQAMNRLWFLSSAPECDICGKGHRCAQSLSNPFLPLFWICLTFKIEWGFVFNDTRHLAFMPFMHQVNLSQHYFCSEP